MMRWLASFLLALSALTAPRAHAEPADIAAAARSVVRVVLISEGIFGGRSVIGHGSGIAIGPDMVLTNAHVVARGRESDSVRIGVVPSQGKHGWFASVVAFSPGNDLALLKLTEPGALSPATLFTGPVNDGENVFAVGYPGNVDLAQGLDEGDIVTPIAPVKTPGTVSSGRSSKQYDTILHTAAIGAGNSGGPLLDACGRVIGMNSFGTEDSSGADSSFYFAVSMREISRFLLAAGVKVQSSGVVCRSIADIDKAEAERQASEKTRLAEKLRADAEKRTADVENARRQAQSEVISARENHIALAGLSFILALAAGALAMFRRERLSEREIKGAWIAAGLLLAGTVLAWVTRPPLTQIESRAREIAGITETPAPEKSEAPVSRSGTYICVLDTARSRVTVSPETDVPINWRDDGCVNGRTQYSLYNDSWSRILVPNQDETVTVASFDPRTATYKTERFLLDLETLQKLRAARSRFTAPSCGDGDAAARKLGEAEATIRALLPPTPNERMVYHCRLTADAAK